MRKRAEHMPYVEINTGIERRKIACAGLVEIAQLARDIPGHGKQRG